MITLLGLRLAGKAVVCVGGGEVTARRARDLLADGAIVTVIAPSVCSALSELPGVTIHHRGYAGPADLHGAWLVHTATDDPATDARVAADAQARRIWCVDATDAERATAHVPARGEVDLGDATLRVAVHGGTDPRRAVTARNAAVDHLASGIVDLRAHRAHTGCSSPEAAQPELVGVRP